MSGTGFCFFDVCFLFWKEQPGWFRTCIMAMFDKKQCIRVEFTKMLLPRSSVFMKPMPLEERMPLLHYPLGVQLCRDDLYLLRTISMIQRKNSGKPTPAMPSKTSQMVQDFCSSTMCQLLQSDLVWTYKWPFSGLKMWPPFGELTGHFKEPGGWFVKLVKPFPTSPDITGWVFLYQWCFRGISRYHDLKNM